MSDTRDEYVARLKKQIDDWNARIDRLEASARLLRDEAKVEFENRIGRARERRDHIQSRMEELQSAGENAWQALTEGVEKAVGELRSAFEDAESFSQKRIEKQK